MSMSTALFNRWRATLTCLLVLLALGLVSVYEIPKQAEPDIDIPIVRISIQQTGIHAQDADRLLVRPMAQSALTPWSVNSSSGCMLICRRQPRSHACNK